jgi:uncharacterized membrane protein (UPF0182 family)
LNAGQQGGRGEIPRHADVATIDWPPARRRGPLRVILLVALVAAMLGGRTALSYYVDALWYGSLGFRDVFWTTLNIQGVVFAIFAGLTFAILYAAFLALKPSRLGELTGGMILINGQPIRLPVGPVLQALSAVVALVIAILTGLGMMAQWMTLAIYWYGGPASGQADPIFGRPVSFYLFTLPAWRLVAGWLLTLALIVCAVTLVLAILTGSTRLLNRRRAHEPIPMLRAFSFAFAVFLLLAAVQVYLAQFERMYQMHPIFDGVSYTDDHFRISGMYVVAAVLALGALIALVNAIRLVQVRWLAIAIAPAVATYVVVSLIAWYVNGFVVKPNELVRETPYIKHNIDLTREAYALDRVTQQSFPAESGVDSLEPGSNQDTLQNIRLWDWRALHDTLRQIQEIRTYYEFPDIDIDRYMIDGATRQVMLAARELNLARLPENSRNWINEKLIYTHGYGITMNPVNGFTPEGLPQLYLSNMPVQSTVAGMSVTRPEIYFGEVTNTDVYVRTRQKEFNFPQGDTNSTTSYEGTGGIAIGGFVRRLLLALDRGDITKLPFSDDITAESRLLMRRNIVERVRTLAPFLTFDPDPYIVLSDDGRLFWMIDGFTMSSNYPYARHTMLGSERINYLRNSVKAVVDAYHGTVAFYVFDREDSIIARYRTIFPGLFQDANAMPASLRQHVRYPELMLQMQAAVYGLYHMTDPAVFYNREDLWSVANEAGASERREPSHPMEANFVLMKLPGEKNLEFIEILPFTPANRNNLIGWIAGRSDDPHYGDAVVYHFPKNRLVDGPQQIEARIDQDAQLSGQLSLWNQQGSAVRRGSLIIIPIGRALLYAESIFLQAARSPMPELRIVVLAIQDRLAYGPSFQIALTNLLQGSSAGSAAPPATAKDQLRPAGTLPAAGSAPDTAQDVDGLIGEAARELAEYQRLTAEGKLGEAGMRLEALKKALDELQRRRR